MHKEQAFGWTARRRTEDSVEAAFSLGSRRPDVAPAYERLLRQVRRRTTLLRPPRDPRRLVRTSVNAGLFALALHHADWLRPPETWESIPANATPQFAALARHLFALYPMPGCMTAAWFVFIPDEPHPEHEWYKHLGRGGSLRTAGVQLRLTRAMAHAFHEAPHHYSVTAGLRWAQVRGLGGDEKLARAVAATRLGREFGHEDFWLTVLRFFVAQRAMDTIHVGPIVDFLQAQRFETREVFVPGRGNVAQEPPQPDYSIKGRTVASLLRQVAEWHRQLGRDDTLPALAWARSAIGGFYYVEETGSHEGRRCWTLHELLTSRELFLEGQALRHCVASYAQECAWRWTTIWSLLLDTGHGPHRALTVQVDPGKRTIRQARGKGNRLPRRIEREVLQRWAEREGLRLADTV